MQASLGRINALGQSGAGFDLPKEETVNEQRYADRVTRDDLDGKRIPDARREEIESSIREEISLLTPEEGERLASEVGVSVALHQR